VTRAAAQQGARCVIAFTDGINNNSERSQKDVIEIAQLYQVPIFIVGFGSVDENILEDIALETGGYYKYINDVYDLAEFYEDIYRQEKEMYLLQFTDESGGEIPDKISLIAGYKTMEYGGECDYSFNPHVLSSVSGEDRYTSGPEAVVEKYIKGYADAITNQDMSYIEDYLVYDSEIYKEQEDYIQKGYEEVLKSYEIQDAEYDSSGNKCIIQTTETYSVQKPDEPLKLIVQTARYKLKKTSDGWKMYAFDGNVKSKKIKS
jgi:hypothetical protein